MAIRDTVFDVVIIGCGPAGIGAAIELQKHRPGLRFLILEARDRVGGRAFTDTQTFGPNAPVDVGARWLYHYHPENPFYTYYSSSDNDRIDSGKFDEWMADCFNQDGRSIPEHLMKQAEIIFDELCAMIKQYPVDKEDISIDDAVRERYEMIENEEIRTLVRLYFTSIEGHEGANLNELSVKSYGLGDGTIDAPILTLANGLGSFIKQIVEENRLPIELNTIVTDIDASNALNEWVYISTSDKRQYACKHVLVTVPLGCLKANSIAFTPPLPDWKVDAIHQMGFGLLNKVFLQFSSVFWDEKLQLIDIIINDYQHAYVCMPASCILVLYISGRHARQMEQQTDEEIVQNLVHSLRRVYPHMTDPIKWLVTRWSQDPFSLGSYSNFSVGANTETVKLLARSTHHDHVHWAGEHTNYGRSIGYVHGAFESGQREAKHIAEALDHSQ